MRELTFDDLNYCAKHRANCYGELLEVSEEKLRKKFLKGKIKFLLEDVGYVMLRDDYDNPAYAHISAILIEKMKHGKGFGSKILKLAEETALKSGFDGITLSVRPEGEDLIHAFYKKNGYEKVKEVNNRVYYLKKIRKKREI
ncbi:MAG: GNAT family N-acetyltransferase [Nanoarchaeota archaeon]|nr:GNAT family N-acetyltransferase [Nanoarchaeota archaeon]